jgi:hypothetical protein
MTGNQHKLSFIIVEDRKKHAVDIVRRWNDFNVKKLLNAVVRFCYRLLCLHF